MGRIHNIEGKKNKMDTQRSSTFTKHAHNISVAVKLGGSDPVYNAALKQAIEKAKADNMPNDNIQRAIKKGSGINDNDGIENIIYEGYGPGGVAMLIECLTDNKNRTAGNIRHSLDKFGGNLGTTGCVNFIFNRIGFISIYRDENNPIDDELLEFTLDLNILDVNIFDKHYEILCSPEDYLCVLQALQNKFTVINNILTLKPTSKVTLSDDDTNKLNKLLDLLEQDDDVLDVHTNIN